MDPTESKLSNSKFGEADKFKWVCGVEKQVRHEFIWAELGVNIKYVLG